jgi:hypothetical protein
MFLASFVFAKDYLITYGDITLGKIDNINTIKEGYLVAKPTNKFLRYLLRFDHYIIYEEGKKPSIEGDNKNKKDKYLILKLVNELQSNRQPNIKMAKNSQTIDVHCKINKCTYTRTKKKKEFTGYINFTQENELDIICDNESNICIKRKNK